MYLSVYYITALGIPAAIVGTIILVTHAWGAVSGPMFSILIEKANLKGGKFKPWIRSVAIIIPVLTVMLYSFTDILVNMSMSARIAYAAITYNIWNMAGTIGAAPALALATVMTSDMSERNRLLSFSRFFGFIGIVIAMLLAPQLIASLDGNWFVPAVILSVISLVFFLGVNITKERITSHNHSATLKQIFGAVFQNRYLLIFVGTLLFINVFNFRMTLIPFIAADVFGDAGLASAIMVISIVPMLLTTPFLPRLAEKFGKNALIKFSLVIATVFSLITYFVGYSNFIVFLVLSVLTMVLSGFAFIIKPLYFADIIEYDFYRKGTRFEAAVFSAQTFSDKAFSALAAAGAMWLIALFGFRESVAGETIVQTRQAIDGIWMTYNIGPVIGTALALIVFHFYYDLDEKKLWRMGKESGRLQAAEKAESESV